MNFWKKIKNQSLEKLAILILNIFRMSYLRMRHYGHFHASWIQNINPSTEISVCDGGTMELAHSVFTRKGVSLRSSGGNMKIGTCFFNQGCSITCLKSIEIGNNCLFGPNVVIVDHDHDYRVLNTKRGSKYICKKVIIGDNVVVGANSIILKGSIIGDNSMIGAGSIVTGTIPPNSLYYTRHEKIQNIIQDKI